MNNGDFYYPKPTNEPVQSYAPGTPGRASLQQKLEQMKKTALDIPMYIDGREVRTGKTVRLHPPHALEETLGHYHQGDKSHAVQAVEAALAAREQWAAMPWEQRAAIFLKAAELIATRYRDETNA